MRKLLFSVLFLLMPVSVFAWTATNHFNSVSEAGWDVYQTEELGEVTITSSQSSPGSPSKSLQVEELAGFFDSHAPGGAIFGFPSPTNEYWMQYYIKYSSNFQHHSISDKQIYTWFGNEAVSCVTFGPNNNTVGNHFAAICENPQGWYEPNTGYNPTINNNQWYKVVFHAKMVSPGNDIFQLWVDDGLVIDIKNTNLAMNSADRASGFAKVAIDPVWGGQASPPVSVRSTQYIWFDHVIVSTDSILPGSLIIGGGGTDKVPSSPKSLIIK